LNGPVSG